MTERKDWIQSMQGSDHVQRRISETPVQFYERKRLSECIEEDEENAEATNAAPTASEPADAEKTDGKSTRVGKFLVTRAHVSENRNLHVDKHFFDDSLIEIRRPESSAAEDAARDYDILQPDNVWVKRSSSPNIGKAVEEVDAGSAPSDVSVTKDRLKTKEKRKKHDSSPDRPAKPDLYTRTIGYGQSNYNRRDSKEDPHQQMYQQTIYGTSGVSRRPALFGVFRNKKPEASPADKKSTFMQQFKSAFQTKPAHVVSPKDGSAHPHGDSDVKYYHTVTAATTRKPNPMHRVMDIFRSKPTYHDTADQRKKYAKNQQTLSAASAKLKRMADQEKAEASKYRRGTTWITKIPESYGDPNQASSVFRSSRGLPYVSPFLKQDCLFDSKHCDPRIYVKFLNFHKCYDLMPNSAKLVVFDTKLLVKDAFYALVYNAIRGAPLWDSKKHEFVGMLTITDFITVLQKYYKNPKFTISELELHRLEAWTKNASLMSLDPDASLYEAAQCLIKNKIHRLPVIDVINGNVLYVLTYRCILRFIFLYMKLMPKPEYLNMTLGELRIGTFENIETVNEDTSVIEALKKFVDRNISSLPLVDGEGKLKDLYEKFDVLNLVAEKTYDFDISLKRALSYRNGCSESVAKVSCSLDTTLYGMMEKIIKAEVQRLVIVDENEVVVGVVSLSDLLKYLVLRPECENNNSLNRLNDSLEKSEMDSNSKDELPLDEATLEDLIDQSVEMDPNPQIDDNNEIT